MTNRASTVSRLPQDIRDKITALRDAGNTIDQILEGLLDDGIVEISRSALGRHLKKQSQVADEIRRSREIAEGIGRTFGDGEASKVARTNFELLHALVLRLMAGGEEDGATIDLDAKQAMLLATALEKLSKAQKSDLEAQIKAAEEAARRKAIEKAADVAANTARDKGLSPETVKEIRAKILGL